MKRVGLKKVIHKCIWDPPFLRAVLRDPERALGRAKMKVSAKDLKRLKRLTSDKKAMKDFALYARYIRNYTHSPQGILW